MKQLLTALLCLLLLTGCASAPEQAEPSPIPDAAPAEDTDVCLTIGRRLPLPVTADSIQAYYQSLDGFYRYVLDVQEKNGDFLVSSVPMPYADTADYPDRKTRFDWVYGETGYCYALLEGFYDMADIVHTGQGSLSIHTADDAGSPIFLSAYLNDTLINPDTGKPIRQNQLYCVSNIHNSPREISLESGALLTLAGDGVSSLEHIYWGADSLELLFDTSKQAAFPQIEISYQPSDRELTLLCRSTALSCNAAGGNLYAESIRAEQRGEDTAVICTLAEEDGDPFRFQYADFFQAEQKFLPGHDWGLGVLRLTFCPFMG